MIKNISAFAPNGDISNANDVLSWIEPLQDVEIPNVQLIADVDESGSLDDFLMGNLEDHYVPRLIGNSEYPAA